MSLHNFLKIFYFLYLFPVLFLASGLSQPVYATSSLTTGLASFWKLEETGGVRTDSAGSNHLSDYNTVTQSAGKVGSAAHFAAPSSQYLKISDNPSVSAGDVDFTISAWVYLDSKSSADQEIVAKWDPAGLSGTLNQREYHLYYYGVSDRFGFSVSRNGLGGTDMGGVFANSLGSPAVGTWYFVVAWHDSVNNRLNIQVNNGAVNSAAYSAGVFDGTAAFTIGSRQSGPAAYLNGKVDAVGFWKRVLTSSERTELYNSGSGIEYPFGSAAGTITITSPVNYRVFQRNSINQSDISIIGTYTGSPTAIEASWNGSPYVMIDSSPTSGNFTGTLANQTAGQGNLTVRFANNTNTLASKNYIGVGDIFVIAGQSNAVGQGTNYQTYSHPTLKASLFGNDDVWKELVDPVDSSVNQVNNISLDSTVGGSVWPPVATLFMASQNVPVAFIPTAQGGASIERWQKTSSARSQGLNLYESMARRINAVGGNIKGVLFWQGERNAAATDQEDASGTVTKTEAVYKNLLTTLANNINTDFPGVKLVVAQIGNRAGASRMGLDNIRLAQQSAWNDNGNVLFGPALYDVNLYPNSTPKDGTHFKSDADIQTAANRWWAALSANYYGGANGRGPRVSSIDANAERNQITIRFDSSFLPLLPASSLGGFTAYNDGVAVTITGINRVSPNELLINLSSPANGTLTLTLQTWNATYSTWPRNIPTDSSTYNLPAEIFINASIPMVGSRSAIGGASKTAFSAGAVLNKSSDNGLLGKLLTQLTAIFSLLLQSRQ